MIDKHVNKIDQEMKYYSNDYYYYYCKIYMFSGMASMEVVSIKKVHLTVLPFIPLVLDRDFGR